MIVRNRRDAFCGRASSPSGAARRSVDDLQKSVLEDLTGSFRGELRFDEVCAARFIPSTEACTSSSRWASRFPSTPTTW